MRVGVLVLGAWMMLPGCNSDPEEVPSGFGTVLGEAFGQPFSFGPSQVVATYHRLDGGFVYLDLHLCEFSCRPLGIVLMPGSRAVIAGVTIAQAELVPGLGLPISDTTRAVAAFRDAVEEAEQRWGETEVVMAVDGRVTLTSVELQPGGRLAGSLELILDQGGVVTSTFDAPLLLSE